MYATRQTCRNIKQRRVFTAVRSLKKRQVIQKQRIYFPNTDHNAE
jgi:hypothetical protein